MKIPGNTDFSLALKTQTRTKKKDLRFRDDLGQQVDPPIPSKQTSTAQWRIQRRVLALISFSAWIIAPDTGCRQCRHKPSGKQTKRAEGFVAAASQLLPAAVRER